MLMLGINRRVYFLCPPQRPYLAKSSGGAAVASDGSSDWLGGLDYFF